MRKYLALSLLLASAILALAGCGDSSEKDVVSKPPSLEDQIKAIEESNAPAEEKQMRIGILKSQAGGAASGMTKSGN